MPAEGKESKKRMQRKRREKGKEEKKKGRREGEREEFQYVNIMPVKLIDGIYHIKILTELMKMKPAMCLFFLPSRNMNRNVKRKLYFYSHFFHNVLKLSL